MISHDLIKTVQHRVIPDSAGTSSTGAYTINLSPTELTGSATSDGANGANSDASEPGREITLIDSAQTWTNTTGRRVLITSGALAGKVLQIVKIASSTATLRYVSSDTSTTILTGVTYKVLADYTVGQKVVIYQVRPYRKATDGATPESGGCSVRIIQNGGTRESWFLGYGSNGQTTMSSSAPIVVDTSDGAPTIQFFKQVIGTTSWSTNIRFCVDFYLV